MLLALRSSAILRMLRVEPERLEAHRQLLLKAVRVHHNLIVVATIGVLLVLLRLVLLRLVLLYIVQPTPTNPNPIAQISVTS